MSKKNEICERHDILISKLIRSEGGIYKRIDENRELITTLIEECPELFEKKPWIYGWLLSQDVFLNDLLKAAVVDFRGVKGRLKTDLRPLPVPAKKNSVIFRI
ncbi:hypothetical protein [Erwinia mallotivora]|uniref:Uncharacterized protein n=1 Tax=Erwinia mallotivora TaxID=69222 RepID=A0A014NKN8_9GAMM|nr:hypothetical protein [Erwinia mallotivora]EXU74340.1 hypothetical protein BG55_18345 [Erwinia mallotivora]